MTWSAHPPSLTLSVSVCVCVFSFFLLSTLEPSLLSFHYKVIYDILFKASLTTLALPLINMDES